MSSYPLKNILTSKVRLSQHELGLPKGAKKAGEQDKNVVACIADLTESDADAFYSAKHSKRFIEIGVS